MAIDYSQLIPNNVDLSSDRRLQRALENWQPRFLDWWKDMGPDGTSAFDVYLRTAISTDAGSVSPCVTIRRRKVERSSPGTSCHTGLPLLSP